MEYTLTDAREMAKKHPSTFFVPGDQVLKKLKPGDNVKVCVNDCERIWTKIVRIDHENEKIKAMVDNEPIYTDQHGLVLDSDIEFEFKHIYDVWI